MNKEKWLICIDWFLPGFQAGGPVSSVRNMLAHINTHYDFYILTSNKDYQSEEAYDCELNKWLKSDGYHIMYVDTESFSKANCAKIIQELKPNGIYLNSIYSKQFTRWPLSIAKQLNIRSIVASRGMLAPSALAIKPVKKKAYLNYCKLKGLFSKSEFHASNETEKAQILDVFPHLQVRIASNLPPKIQNEGHGGIVKSETLRMIYLGRIAPEKNILFGLQCLRDLPMDIKVELDMYGATYDLPYWSECGTLIGKLKSNITVNYKGVISPIEISDMIQNYHFLFLPSRGENFGHVIIEALSVGTPVIISNKTPWQDLETFNCGFIANIDSGTREMMNKISNAFSMDPKDYEDMRFKAKKYADAYLTNTKAVEAAIELFA